MKFGVFKRKLRTFLKVNLKIFFLQFVNVVEQRKYSKTNQIRNVDIDNLLIGKLNLKPQYQKEGVQTDFLGTKELHLYLPKHHELAPPGALVPSDLAHEEEYFEWLDILESAREAENTFTFIELGAGYGRWSARAFNAAKHFGFEPDQIAVITVEADPMHSLWCVEHMRLNDIPTTSHKHFEVALSDQVGQAEFFVKHPSMSRDESAKNWYGQSLAKSGWSGAETIKVPLTTLKEILNSAPFEIIDLIDSDLQGEDWKTLSHQPNLLNKVKRIHIGTDSTEEEIQLRRFFSNLGWINLRDIRCQGKRKTYIGKVKFVDGVQTWLNPRFI